MTAHPAPTLMIERFSLLLLIVLALVVVSTACGGGSNDRERPGVFESVVVASGLEEPADFAFVSERRVFVAERRGVVRVIDEGALLPEPLVSIEEQVNAYEQRGLLGIAIDPDFAENGYLYLFFTYEHDASDPMGPKTGRLLRVTVEGDAAVPGSEEVILGTSAASAERPTCADFPEGADCIPHDSEIHIGGAMRFASDGTLFLSTGDSAHEDDLRVRAQMLGSLAGKILRINPDGTAPPDNPLFTGDPSANQSKVWAYGVREPFRFALQPGTDLPFVGDVGSLYQEEISIARAGANLGWPCFEGDEPPFAIGVHEICDDLRARPQDVTMPIYSYATKPAAAIVGGDFAQAYPQHEGAFFFADFARSWIAYLDIDNAGNVTHTEELPIAPDGPVALRTAPDGEIYYLSWYTGELRRIRWVTQ